MTTTTSTSLLEKFWFVLVVLLIAALAGLTWVNYRYVQENPGGNDFLVHWVGTRALLVDGLSPYSDPVARQIQTMAYGRPARPGEHELRVAYPLYAGIIFTPFALVSDFTLARALWMTFLFVSLVSLAFFCVRLLDWQPSLWLFLFFILFSLLWYHSVRPLINGNAVILVALFVAGVFLAMRHGRDELAGILLALTTIKPHLVVLLIAFVWLWAISVRRWPVVVWTVITLVLLSALAFLFVPDWPLQNLREIIHYPEYNPPGTPGEAFKLWWPAAGSRLGWILTVLLGILILGEWLLALGKNVRWFLWTACLTLVAGQWTGIRTDPGNYIILFPALVLLFAVWQERWGPRSQWTILIMMFVVFFGLWVLFLRTVEYGTQPQQHPLMLFPLPLFLLIGLYWIRWWAVRPQKLLIEVLRERVEQ